MSNNDMLGAVVRELVELPAEMFGVLLDLLERLLGQNGVEWLEKLKQFLRGENVPLLQVIRSVTLPTIHRFNAVEVLGCTLCQDS